MTTLSRPVSESQTLSVRSLQIAASSLPSGLNSGRERMMGPLSLKERIVRPLSASQICNLLSFLPEEASLRPSGL